MIYKEYGKYNLLCDVCGEPHTDSPFDNFYDAVDAAAISGWESKLLTKGSVKEWINTCPTCLSRVK